LQYLAPAGAMLVTGALRVTLKHSVILASRNLIRSVFVNRDTLAGRVRDFFNGSLVARLKCVLPHVVARVDRGTGGLVMMECFA
jgi:hypothetical protein